MQMPNPQSLREATNIVGVQVCPTESRRRFEQYDTASLLVGFAERRDQDQTVVTPATHPSAVNGLL